MLYLYKTSITMDVSIDEIQSTYNKLSDYQISEIATDDVTGLRTEAIDILKSEIKKRQLGDGLLHAIDIQLRELTENERYAYINIIRNLPCPICNSTHQPLNGIITAAVTSFIFFTNHNRALIIACPDCLKKANHNALIKTLIFGWWGFPWGPIRTIRATITNGKMRKECDNPDPSMILVGFVAANIAKIESNRNNTQGLLSLIKRSNS